MLLSGMMRAAAFTGDPTLINQWCSGRQYGRWMYATPRPADPKASLKTLTELHERGVVDDAEYERLRARVKG
jgi:hypothetical protein